jgi:uncharacterized protein (TIGR03435 family)
MKMRNGVSGALAAILLLAPAAVFAQTTEKPAPTAPARFAFEVASVKPSAPLDVAKLAAEIQAGDAPRFGAHVEGTLAEYRYMSLKELIANAYGLKPYQVYGPAWLATDRFDIEARMPAGSSKSDAPQMLQALLARRFGLVAQRSAQLHRVLVLMVAKGGPKMQPSSAPPPPIDLNAPLKPGQMKIETANGPALVTRNPDGSVTIDMGPKGIVTQKFEAQAGVIHIESSALTMTGLADLLTNVMQMNGPGLQVIDQTGLKGNYQVAVDIPIEGLIRLARANGLAPPPPPAKSGEAHQLPGQTASEPGTGAGAVFASVEKLGLRLDHRKATVERLIVSKIDKTPTPN